MVLRILKLKGRRLIGKTELPMQKVLTQNSFYTTKQPLRTSTKLYSMLIIKGYAAALQVIPLRQISPMEVVLN
ncbi:MAG: hypothetical protein N2167_02990 [Flavobacteriales bacterium]|nr:hypothetical protein [Flavobacteriales bacterium]